MVLLSFILGEVILLALVAWIYVQLGERGALPREPQSRSLIAILMFLVPLALGALTLPGVLWRLEEARGSTVASDRPTVVASPTLGLVIESNRTLEPAESQAAEVNVPPTRSATQTIAAVQSTKSPEPSQTPTSVTPTAETVIPEPTLTQPPSTQEATIIASEIPTTSVSSPSGKIVYVCQVFRDTDRDQICLMNADGSEQRRLTQNDAADYNYPSFSPSGEHIVFVGKERDFFEIFEMDLETGEILQRTNFSSTRSGDALAPEISPDGQKILYAMHANGYNSLWVMNRDGSSQQMIFGPPEGYGWDPVWSPDGREILFASYQGGLIQLFIIGADGSNFRQVTDMVGIRGRNDWSPDGLIIATYVGESWQREIYVMDVDGSDPRSITEGGNNLAPGFSPDGQWIVFTSYRDNNRDENGCEIYTMHRDGSLVNRLTENDYCDWQPRWGP